MFYETRPDGTFTVSSIGCVAEMVKPSICAQIPGKGEVESWSKRCPNVGRRTSFIYTQEKALRVGASGIILDWEPELPTKFYKTRITAQRIEPGFNG